MQQTRRGRPQEADPREIARIALDLFEREVGSWGYGHQQGHIEQAAALS